MFDHPIFHTAFDRVPPNRWPILLWQLVMVALWMRQCAREGAPIGDLWVDESGMIYRVPPARFDLVRTVSAMALTQDPADTPLDLCAGQGGFTAEDDGWLSPVAQHPARAFSCTAHVTPVPLDAARARRGVANHGAVIARIGGPGHLPCMHHPPPA